MSVCEYRTIKSKRYARIYFCYISYSYSKKIVKSKKKKKRKRFNMVQKNPDTGIAGYLEAFSQVAIPPVRIHL